MNRKGVLPAISATDYKDAQKVLRIYEKSDCSGWHRKDGQRES